MSRRKYLYKFWSLNAESSWLTRDWRWADTLWRITVRAHSISQAYFLAARRIEAKPGGVGVTEIKPPPERTNPEGCPRGPEDLGQAIADAYREELEQRAQAKRERARWADLVHQEWMEQQERKHNRTGTDERESAEGGNR